MGHVAGSHGRERERDQERSDQDTGESQSLLAILPVAGAITRGSLLVIVVVSESATNADCPSTNDKRSPASNRRTTCIAAWLH
jgi:hypothetical protein